MNVPNSNMIDRYSDFSFDINPEPGYEIESVLINGVNHGRIDKVELKEIADNYDIEVNFQPDDPAGDCQILKK